MTEQVTYHDGGQICIGELALPAGEDKRPGIVVVHEAWGLGEHAIKRAEMLAELGYLALAADIFGDRHIPADPPEAFSIIGKFRADPDALRARVGAALDVLAAHPRCDGRLGGIGFCFGGSTVLEIARSGRAGVHGVVSFHGALASTKPAEPGAVTARVLVCHGAEDTIVGHDELGKFLDEMGVAGADCTTIAYTGAGHSFTNPAADGTLMQTIKYHEQTDQRSWTQMRAFFAEVFG